MSAPYPEFGHLWPLALLLLLICTPKTARRWILKRLQWLGLAIGLLLLLPYLLS